jgi:hypothetical protein
MISTTALRSKLDRVIGLRDGVVSRLESSKEEAQRLEAEETVLALIQTLFQTLVDQEVSIGVQAVEKLQTEGLQAVFGDQDLRVKSTVDIQRGKVSVELLTVQHNPDGLDVEGESGDSFGGAVATVQSVLLRVIIMLRRGLRPLLLLDETLPAFDANYVTNMGSFLAALCRRLGMDILLVTHNPALAEAADHSYRLVRKNGVVKVEVVK